MGEILVREIERLKREVLEMGGLACSMLGSAVKALEGRDADLAEEVIANTRKIMEMDGEIEERLLQTIALYQPVSRDLRTLGAMLKMITYLTRIGRYAKDIAKTAKLLADEEHIAKLVEIPYMADIVKDMISSALRAFEEENGEYIEGIAEKDDSVDALYYSIFRECITYMMEDPKKIRRCMHYIMVARYLERCGDHACKISEKVHYMLTGERIEIK